MRRAHVVRFEMLAILFALSCLSDGTYGMLCSKGEKLHTPREGHDVCILCSNGTFMHEENHSLKTCQPCTKIENSAVEVLVSPCNRTHDAVVLCASGFYRRKARNVRQKDRCQRCTECPFSARECGGYFDTVCCLPNHEAVISSSDSEVFVCKEKPIVCGPGQFFATYSEECLPCPDGTFMSAQNHTHHECLKCVEISGNNDSHAVIITPCSRAAPTLFGCEKGYFRDSRQASMAIEVPCAPCGSCGPECNMFQDAPWKCSKEDIQIVHGKSDGSDSQISQQENDSRNLADDESNSQPGKTDAKLPIFNNNSTFKNVLHLHWLFVYLLLLTILMLVLKNREKIVLADPEYNNKLRYCCNRPTDKICQFIMIFLIVLCIAFQIVVTFVEYTIKPRAVETLAVERILMNLSIINIFVVCIVILYIYYRTCIEKCKTHLRDVLRKKQPKQNTFLPKPNKLDLNMCNTEIEPVFDREKHLNNLLFE